MKKTKEITIEPLLTTQEVADYFKTSVQQVRKMAAEGTLSAMKVGREYRFTRQSIEDFINESIN